MTSIDDETRATTRGDDAIGLRPAEPSELPALGELTLAAYDYDYELPDGYRDDLSHPERRIGQFDAWVAFDRASGELLGTVSVLRSGAAFHGELGDDELYFRLLAVSPNARRRGVGALLTRFTSDLARERGKRRVVLNSAPEMLGAHALYRKLGFVHRADRDVHVKEEGREFHVLTFTLELDGPQQD